MGCDVGSPPAALAQLFPDFDFSHLSERWWWSGQECGEVWEGLRRGGGEESEESLEERVEGFRAWLGLRPERRVVVVGHSEFFHVLTGHKVEGELFGHHMDPGEVYLFEPQED
eukprot:NODE_8560_length_405_cov_9.657303_g7683_i0.p2 GENE.NODE_8560_length_405_cov_9.657303_g7683_i0~~NODE_8560_length_405_cov_9.657303_g7683_i0.p2  ORF type:complete len:121 (+),score=36.40 NODE_8560_length_405_cov_9.657303_g7683_i0:25-363(+)